MYYYIKYVRKTWELQKFCKLATVWRQMLAHASQNVFQHDCKMSSTMINNTVR